MAQIPRIDPSVVHVTLGQFRRLGGEDLPAKTYVINDGGGQPIAVCVPYETFMEMQRAIEVAPPILPAPAGHVGPDASVGVGQTRRMERTDPPSPLRGV